MGNIGSYADELLVINVFKHLIHDLCTILSVLFHLLVFVLRKSGRLSQDSIIYRYLTKVMQRSGIDYGIPVILTHIVVVESTEMIYKESNALGCSVDVTACRVVS